MKYFYLFLFSVLGYSVGAQETLPLTDLSFWKPTQAANWQIAGDASAPIDKDDVMTTAKGTGVLVNVPDAKNRANLLSAGDFGDVDVSFDFMMARNSNSGFYLQGRYEVQLLDSWGHQDPTFGDCGGVYARRRWNPDEQLFDGHAPRINACTAPGLWQHLDISFQAPKFDAAGKKIANAKLVKVALNGFIVLENVELTGPTGGPISEQEAARGPFMIQGDHGPVAFRNITITDKGGVPVTSGKFNYKVIYGDFRFAKEFAGKKIDKEGTTDKLTWEVAGKDNGYALFFDGTINCPKAGKHHIVLQVGGRSSMKINGKEVMEDKWTYSADQRTLDVDLPAGASTIELVNYKMDGWMPPFLGLWVEGPGAPEAALHTMGSVLALEAHDPITLDAATPKVFRSFMDITMPNALRGEHNFLNFNDPHRKRIVHAVHVGDPMHFHYTYDLDNGAVAQLWKGDFLNTSPMWDDRGDGSSRPRGPVLAFDDVQTVVPKAKLFDLTPSQNNPVDGFRPLGYDLDPAGYPTFRYALDGKEVQDQCQASDGKMLKRSITLGDAKNGDWVVRLATGKKIEKTGDNLWAVDDKHYYIQAADGTKPVLESSGNISVLYVPATAKVEWSVLW